MIKSILNHTAVLLILLATATTGLAQTNSIGVVSTTNLTNLIESDELGEDTYFNFSSESSEYHSKGFRILFDKDLTPKNEESTIRGTAKMYTPGGTVKHTVPFTMETEEGQIFISYHHRYNTIKVSYQLSEGKISLN